MLDKSTLATALRFTGYTLAIVTCTAALPVVVRSGGVSVAKESGPIEMLQLALLSASMLVLAGGAVWLPRMRLLLLGLATAAGFAVCREMDTTLGRLIPVVGWKFGVLLPVGGIVLAWMHREAIPAQVALFARSRALVLLWAGFVMAVPVAQLIGHGNFLQAAMGDEYTRDYKRLIEELGELIGYMLFFMGTVEFLVEFRRHSGCQDG